MLSGKMTVDVPNIVNRKVPTPLFCGPGPCDMWPSVFDALSKPVISPLCEEYYHVIDEIRAGIKYLFQTRSPLVLAMSGSGHCAMEAVITNLVGPGETLLLACRGFWDDRALDIAQRFGINTVITRVPVTATFSLDHLESELKRVRPKALFITHGDSSTGTVQKIEGLGQICHKYGALLLVDTVVSIGGVPFLMDEWEVDGVYSSTQKALAGPAGISAVGFSARAEEMINKRSHKPSFYFDIKLLAEQWNCYGDTRKYHHTMSPPLLWALRACLMEISKETLPKSWKRHASVAAHFQKRLQECGLQYFVPKHEDRLATVATIVLPKGYDHDEFSTTSSFSQAGGRH